MISLSKVYLKTGEIYVQPEPAIVWTVLGSCVSVVLHSAKKGISAVSHAQLPAPANKSETCSSTCPKPCMHAHEDITTEMRFVSCSIKFMLDEMRKMGIQKSELQAYLFGGSTMFQKANDYFAIGRRNAEMAESLLSQYGIPLVAKDVLGNKSRTLLINTTNAEYSVEMGMEE